MQLKLSNFTFDNFADKYRDAKKANLKDITIHISLITPDFEHHWTVDMASTLKEWKEELDETKRMARYRLKLYSIKMLKGVSYPTHKAKEIIDGKRTIQEDWQKKVNEWIGGWMVSYGGDEDKVNEFIDKKRYKNKLGTSANALRNLKIKSDLTKSMINESIQHLLRYTKKNNPTPNQLRSHFTKWAGNKYGKSMLYREPGSKTNRQLVVNSLQESGFVKEYAPRRLIQTTKYFNDITQA